MLSNVGESAFSQTSLQLPPTPRLWGQRVVVIAGLILSAALLSRIAVAIYNRFFVPPNSPTSSPNLPTSPLAQKSQKVADPKAVERATLRQAQNITPQIYCSPSFLSNENKTMLQQQLGNRAYETSLNPNQIMAAGIRTNLSNATTLLTDIYYNPYVDKFVLFFSTDKPLTYTITNTTTVKSQKITQNSFSFSQSSTEARNSAQETKDPDAEFIVNSEGGATLLRNENSYKIEFQGIPLRSLTLRINFPQPTAI